jgi:two-component system sensor histidine kinase KdpD
MTTPDDSRPDPDELLRKLQREEQAETRGRLRIYLGAAPGVGKTYAMLHEGARRKGRGTDVVVGYVETYNRPLTLEALEGLEVIPRKVIEYQGVKLEEMDVAAVIARRPKVALIDELAHTNAPGSEHEKRWQDIHEILDAGISVISTLNIQHLESLNDVVAGITGVKVRETVPDAVVDDADEVEVIDVSPEALQARMRHGNIYPPAQAEQALRGFFRRGNLAALRQLVLQRVVTEVEQQLDQYMREHHIDGWEAGEKVLVLLDGTGASEVAIRRAWRLAHALNAELLAAYPSTLLKLQGMTHLLTVAMDLNAELRPLPGERLADELEQLIRSEHVGHVTLIRPHAGRFWSPRRRSLADVLLERLPHLDVHLVAPHTATA